MRQEKYTTTHFGGQLLVMTGDTVYESDNRVTDPIREGLRIIVMLSGGMSLKAGDAPQLNLSSPSSFAVLSDDEMERDQSFEMGIPVRLILLQVGTSFLETELGLDCDRVFRSEMDNNNHVVVHVRETNSAMRAVGSQLLACPTEASQNLYRCAKAVELTSLFLDGLDRKETLAASRNSAMEIDRAVAARDILISDLESAPDLSTVAKLCGTNLWTLNRDFRATYGVTPYAYLQEYRLQHAFQLLASGQLAVGQVAHATGYNSQSHFTALFRKRFDITPGALLARSDTRSDMKA